MVCAAKGYELVLTLPQGMSRERESAAARCTAPRCEMTESLGGMNEAVARARASWPRSADVFLPDQFSNPANPEAHRRTTGPEIERRARRQVGRARRRRRHRRHDHRRGRVCCASATRRCASSRSSRAARRCSPAARAGPAPHPGHRRRLRARVLNRELIDEVIAVSATRTRSRPRWRCARREEGVLAGISCGAALRAALEVAARPELRRQADRGDHAGLGRALHVAGRSSPA